MKCINVSPNRHNLRFFARRVKKPQQLKELDWLITLLRNEGVECPKTIAFSSTINELALITNYIMSKLGRKMFSPAYSPVQDNCLIGIYHSNSWRNNKNRVMEQFKGSGVKRVVVASTALFMGVNFPDVRYFINWGPARSILDQHQEAGRAGRDGEKSHVIVLFNGRKLHTVNRKSKTLSVQKGVFVFLPIGFWIIPFSPLNHGMIIVLFVLNYVSVGQGLLSTHLAT